MTLAAQPAATPAHAECEVDFSRRYTREEYSALPEGPPYYELTNGELNEMSPRPPERHQELLAALIGHLRPHVLIALGGRLVPEPNLYLPNTEDVYQPDFVYVARGQLRIRRRGGIYGVPELVCEILSPSTVRRDRGVKMEAFKRAGVSHLWLIESEPTLVVEEYMLTADDQYHLQTTVRAPAMWSPTLFPDWSLDLGEVQTEIALPEETDDAGEAEEGERP